MLSVSFDLTPIYLSFKIKQTKNVSSFLSTHPSHAVGSCGWQWVNAASAQMPHTWEAEASGGAGYKERIGSSWLFFFLCGAGFVPAHWGGEVLLVWRCLAPQWKPPQNLSLLCLKLDCLFWGWSACIGWLSLLPMFLMAGGLEVLLEVTAVSTETH